LHQQIRLLLHCDVVIATPSFFIH